MKIAVCDDNENDRAVLRGYINEYLAKRCADAVTEEFSSGEELIPRFASHGYDLVFLDIYMNKLNGIQTAEKIRELDKTAAIIFTTTSAEFAVESYDFDAVSYLLKPIDKEKLFKALDKCGDVMKKELAYIEVMSNRLTERIYIKDIRYVETFGRKSVIYCSGIGIDTNTPLVTLESELKKHGFIRVSRCAVVNPARVRLMHDDCFIMEDGKSVMFSIKEKTRIKQEFLGYCRIKTRG